MNQTVADWAHENWDSELSHPMCWPGVIYRANVGVGIGTWIFDPHRSFVITAHHLFPKDRGMITYAFRPLGGGKRYGINYPEPVPNVNSRDVVKCDFIRDGTDVFTGSWDRGNKAAPLSKSRDIRPRLIKNLITGTEVVLSKTIKRTDEDLGYQGNYDAPRGAGESGTGFVGFDNLLYIYLAGSDNTDLGSFSPGIKFE